MTNPTAAELIARTNRLGADPKNTNYAGGNTSAKGTETDPVTGRAGRAALGQGLRRRPRHPDRVGPRRAAPRPHARPRRTSTPASSARTRWSPPSTTRCTARAGPPRRSTPPCTAWWMPRTSTTCIPTPASPSRPRPTARSSPTKAFGDKVVWVPWRRPGFQLGARHRRDQGGEPAGDRLHPRRPRHHGVGRHVATRPRRTGSGSSRPPRPTSTEHGTSDPFGTALDGYERRCREPSAARRRPRSRRHLAASPPPTSRWSATSPTPRSCSTSSPVRAPPPRRARHQLPRPLPAHQGQADAARPARRRAPSRSRSRG